MQTDQRALLGTVVLVADTPAKDLKLGQGLEERGYKVRYERLGLKFDVTPACEVCVIAVHRNCGWVAGMVTALRSAGSACASIITLETGDSHDVGQVLRSGAVDCLVNPISASTLLDSVAIAIACTRRWRERVRSASARPSDFRGSVSGLRAISDGAQAEASSPVDDDSRVTADPEQRIERVVHRLGGQNQLTRREREVLYWLLQGHRYDDIATVLGVVPRTAKFHASNLLRKLELDSRHDLPRLLAREA